MSSPFIAPAILMMGRLGISVATSTGRGALAFGRGARSLGVGAMKIGAITGITSALSRTENIDRKASDDFEQTYQRISKPSILSAESERQRQVTDRVLTSTLAFSEYVENQTEEAEPVSSIGPELPELVINRKYSPIMKSIIENINGIKQKIDTVEIRLHNQDQILLNLGSASSVLGDEMVKVQYDEKKARFEEDLRRDEEKIEGKTIGDYVMRAGKKAQDVTKSIYDMLKPMLTAFGLPLALLYASQVDFAGGGDDEEQTLGRTADRIQDTLEVATIAGRSTQGVFAGQQRNPRGLGPMRRVNEILQRQRQGRWFAIALRLSELGAVFDRLGAGRFFNAVLERLSGLPEKFREYGRKALRKITGFYLLGRSLVGLINILTAEDVSEEVVEREIKKFLVDAINVIGIPLLIGVAVGFAFGGIGSLPGAILGFIATILLGDKVSKTLRVPDVVDALYDAVRRGDFTKLNNLLSILIGGADRMATQEEIEEQYGKDLSSTQLLEMATLGAGTDENAVLYAFRDIDSRAGYEQFKQKFESENLPNYKTLFGNQKYETMEEFLMGELLPEEREQLARQLDQQIALGGTMSAEERNVLLRNTLEYDTREQIVGYGGVTDEEYSLYQRGEIVPVTTKTGERKLMTEEQFMSSDEVGISARESATKRIERNRRIYEAQREQMRNIVPTQNSMASVQIVPIPMTIPMNNSNMSPSVNGERAPISNPQPTISTTDSFINLSYAT